MSISKELKDNLQDAMAHSHMLTLAKALGEAEFVALVEGQLNQEQAFHLQGFCEGNENFHPYKVRAGEVFCLKEGN